jgi:cell division protein FtsL
MRIRGVLTAFSAMLLLAGMFAAVHRGSRGHATVERISQTNDLQAAAQTKRNELAQEIQYLRSRTRVVRAAETLGLHLPNEEELVILELGAVSGSGAGGSR